MTPTIAPTAPPREAIAEARRLHAETVARADRVRAGLEAILGDFAALAGREAELNTLLRQHPGLPRAAGISHRGHASRFGGLGTATVSLLSSALKMAPPRPER